MICVLEYYKIENKNNFYKKLKFINREFWKGIFVIFDNNIIIIEKKVS